jgi:outer membrane lipoprotein LolB
MLKKRLQIIALLVFTCLLAACATRPAKNGALNQHLSWQQRQQQLAALKNWRISGEIGGQITQQQKTKAFSASVVWQQQGDAYHISIFGPLGADMTQLQGNATQAVLTTSKHQKIAGQNPEQLLETELGWSLPVSNLYYWVRGIPAPNAPSTPSFDHYHHLSTLTQQGWQIQYLRYTAVGHHYDLPSKIFISRPNLKLRLIISQWQLNKGTVNENLVTYH